MNFRRSFGFLLIFSGLALISAATFLKARGKDHTDYQHVCSEPNPESMCTVSNTCGSDSAACVMDVKRSGGSSASATPNIPNAKGNALVCVRAGTTVQWRSASKDTGFVLDFGASSPFERTGAIIGGSDRTISLAAKRAGCFKYSTGACTSGSIYGMCGTAESEMVVISAGTQTSSSGR
jgi:hypothetical protein